MARHEFKIVPDSTSLTGFRVVRVEHKPAVPVQLYEQMHDEAFGVSGDPTIEALKVVKGLCQDINKLKAEKSKNPGKPNDNL